MKTVWAMDIAGILLLAGAGLAIHWGVSLTVLGLGALGVARLIERGKP